MVKSDQITFRISLIERAKIEELKHKIEGFNLSHELRNKVHELHETKLEGN